MTPFFDGKVQRVCLLSPKPSLVSGSFVFQEGKKNCHPQPFRYEGDIVSGGAMGVP